MLSQTRQTQARSFGRLKEMMMMMTHTTRRCHLLTTKKPKQQTPQITPTKQPSATQKRKTQKTSTKYTLVGIFIKNPTNSLAVIQCLNVKNAEEKSIPVRVSAEVLAHHTIYIYPKRLTVPKLKPINPATRRLRLRNPLPNRPCKEATGKKFWAYSC